MKLLLLALAVSMLFFSSCLSKHDGEFLKSIDGKIYLLKKDAVFGDQYSLFEMDTTYYNKLFPACK